MEGRWVTRGGSDLGDWEWEYNLFEGGFVIEEMKGNERNHFGGCPIVGKQKLFRNRGRREKRKRQKRKRKREGESRGMEEDEWDIHIVCW